MEKAKRKVEQDLKMTQETVDDLERVKRELEEGCRKRDQEINSLNNRVEDDASQIAMLQKKIKELQVNSKLQPVFFYNSRYLFTVSPYFRQLPVLNTSILLFLSFWCQTIIDYRCGSLLL